MDKIPNRLECAYCIRHVRHGGECAGKEYNNDTEGCLIFKFDEMGCIKNRDFKLQIALYKEIPYVDMWDDGWQINGIDTKIKIKKIYGITWDNKSGYLILFCNLDYYVNEFSDEYKNKDKDKKPVLKIIK